MPWSALRRSGHEVVFATEHGAVAECDPLLLSGVVFGRLGAGSEAKDLYGLMTDAPEFLSPISWGDVEPSDFDGLILPGGHAPGMRQYLDSAELREKVAGFWALSRPVGAICHGVLVLARTRDPGSARSVIADLRTTCLPKYMERDAYWLTAWRLGRYYRTYRAYVEDEVRSALSDPSQLVRGPRVLYPARVRHRRPAGVHRERRQISLGPVAGRRVPVQLQVPRAARLELRARWALGGRLAPLRRLNPRRTRPALRACPRSRGSRPPQPRRRRGRGPR